MNRTSQIGILAVGAFAIGCAGSNTGASSYGGGYDPSLNSPGTANATGKPGSYPTPNAAAWPVENGAQIVIRGIAAPSIVLTPAKEGDANPYKGDQANAAFKDINGLGLNVVKIQLFDGTRGLKIDKDGNVSGVQDVVLKNLDDVVERAKVEKVLLLIEFESSFTGFTKSPISDKKQREDYCRNVLSAVARRLKAKDSVFGFDLSSNLYAEMTPKAAMAPKSEAVPKAATPDKDPVIDKDVIRAFTKDAIDAIKRQDPQRLVSSGPIPLEGLQNGFMGGLGMDFYSLYRADDKGVLPDPLPLRLDRPLIAGYVAQASPTKNESVQSAALHNFIKSATDAKYNGYVVWSYSTAPADDALSIVDKDGKHKPAAEAVRTAIQETRKE